MTSKRWPPILRRWRAVPGSVHAVRVALAASLLIVLVYVGCVVVLDVLEARRLVAAVDARLHERLTDASAGHLYTQAGDDDADEAPIFLWLAKPAARRGATQSWVRRGCRPPTSPRPRPMVRRQFSCTAGSS